MKHRKRAAWFGRGAVLCHTDGFLSMLAYGGHRRVYRDYFKDSDRRARKANR